MSIMQALAGISIGEGLIIVVMICGMVVMVKTRGK